MHQGQLKQSVYRGDTADSFITQRQGWYRLADGFEQVDAALCGVSCMQIGQPSMPDDHRMAAATSRQERPQRGARHGDGHSYFSVTG